MAYDPAMMKNVPHEEKSWKHWVCVDCGHEVSAIDRPAPIRWTDGHCCRFQEVKPDAEPNNQGDNQ